MGLVAMVGKKKEKEKGVCVCVCLWVVNGGDDGCGNYVCGGGNKQMGFFGKQQPLPNTAKTQKSCVHHY